MAKGPSQHGDLGKVLPQPSEGPWSVNYSSEGVSTLDEGGELYTFPSRRWLTSPKGDTHLLPGTLVLEV